MKSRLLVLLLLLSILAVGTSAGFTFFKKDSSGDAMTKAAQAYLQTLSEKQRSESQLKFDVPSRFDWHFIPKDSRKGMQLKEMNDKQRKAAHTLLQASLSKMGYDKSVTIMELESVLNFLEKGKGRNIRDAQRYYWTLFGEPDADGRWGLSIEGHHLSFNFVVDQGEVVATTPQFLATNPAVVKDAYIKSIKKGTRVLAKEETLAFELVNSLNKEQLETAQLADKAPGEIRGAGEAQPPKEKPAGLAAAKLNDKQTQLLKQLIEEYIAAMPSDVATQRRQEIEEAGFEKIQFAWAGALKPGVGHYYRIEGPTFQIEFVNVQPDPAGNPANHIHCVWRDPRGDFGVKLN